MPSPRNEGGREPLDLIQNFFRDEARAAAYGRLVEIVFGSAPDHSMESDPSWEPLAYFDTDGTCVAGIEFARLMLVLDGVDAGAMAIRLAGVAPSHRGRGLFQDLMARAVALGEHRAPGAPTLLYTEDEGLYARFGFVPVAQHAFVGAPPRAVRTAAARLLDRNEALMAIDRLATARRAPVSSQCAVRGAAGLLRANLDDDELRFAIIEDPEALLIYEMDDEELVLVDIVARTIPTMAEVISALRSGSRRVRTLFPPDLLAWDGVPDPDETGLMLRGPLPAAMRRPFMLPPTTSF